MGHGPSWTHQEKIAIGSIKNEDNNLLFFFILARILVTAQDNDLAVGPAFWRVLHTPALLPPCLRLRTVMALSRYGTTHR